MACTITVSRRQQAVGMAAEAEGGRLCEEENIKAQEKSQETNRAARQEWVCGCVWVSCRGSWRSLVGSR